MPSSRSFVWHEDLQLYGVHLPAPFERYWISPLRAGDEDALFSIFDDPRMHSRLYRQPIPYTTEYAQSVIARNAGYGAFNEILRNHQGEQSAASPPRIPDDFWGGLRDATGTVVATMDLSQRKHPNAGHKRFIGFFLHPDLQGRGLMSVAARTMLETLDAYNGQELIYGIAREDNPASQIVLGKLGFSEQERFVATDPPDKGGKTHRAIAYARPAATSRE